MTHESRCNTLSGGMKWAITSCLLWLLACGEGLSPTDSAQSIRASGIDVGGCVPAATLFTTQNGLTIEFEGADGDIPLNQLFGLIITVSGTPEDVDVSVFVDATMPAHNHGMNTVPTIEPIGDQGQFRVSNMNLHMPGEWELSILVVYGEAAEQIRTTVDCSEAI